MVAFNPGMQASSNPAYSPGGMPVFDGENFLPKELGVFFWIKSYAPSTITESSGSVSQWDDLSNNAFNITQGTGSQQPTTNATAENGRNIIDFDGGDNLIMPSGVFVIPDGSNTIFAASKRTSEDSTFDHVIGMATGASSDYIIRYSSTAGTIAFKSRSGAAGTLLSTGNTNTDFQIINCRRDGTTQAMSINGEAEITNASGQDAASIDDAFIGQSGTETLSLTGSLGEIILYNRSLSTLEIPKVNRYLSKIFGITLV